MLVSMGFPVRGPSISKRRGVHGRQDIRPDDALPADIPSMGDRSSGGICL